jgi:tryptophan synthase alpha chain
MIAPTSQDRIKMIAKDAKGYIYVVSSLGVTGSRSSITTDIGSMVKLVKECTDIPCAVGFGISNAGQAEAMAKVSDGAIVGSAIVKIIAEHGKDAPEKVGAFVKELAQAVHGA